MPALTGCDTTNKISTEHAAMKAIHNNLTLIQNFNNLELTECDADGRKFSGKVSQANKRLGNINNLRLAAFNSNSLKMDFETIPFTSVNA